MIMGREVKEMGCPTDHTQVQVCDTHWEGKVLGWSQKNTEQINESQRRNQHYEI